MSGCIARIEELADMKTRRSLSMLGVAATALAGVALASGPASASAGGGCGTEQGNVEACLSANGNLVVPDAYVISSPSNCNFVVVQVIDDSTGAVIETERTTCSLGHKGPWSFAGANGHYYKVTAQMSTTNGGLFPSTSPTLKLAY
jgi:hypothetical protein